MSCKLSKMLVNQLRKDFLKICGDPKIKRVLSRTKEILPPTPSNNNRGNSIHLTTIQKTILGFGSSLVSLYNPTRIDMLNCCAEILCSASLQKILDDMKLDSVGRRILEEKPNICTIANAEKLIELPEKTFGFALGKFLMKHAANIETRTAVRFIDDPNLAYIMERCRQIHDCLHVVLNIPTNKVGEITIKWVEALNAGLTTTYLAAIVGGAHIPRKERENFIQRYLPLAILNGKNTVKYYLIYWEQMYEEDLGSLRRKIQITAFP